MLPEYLPHELLEPSDIVRIHLHILVVTILGPQRLDWIKRCHMQRLSRRDVHNIILQPLQHMIAIQHNS